MTTQKQPWLVIGRGFNGWHASRVNCSLSGAYGEARGAELARDAADGALVYDASAADSGAFVRLVLSGPMVDPALPPDGVDSCSAGLRHAMLEMAPALGGAFQTYALAAQDEKFRGLDRVGTGVYEALLRTVPGVKIGRVVAGEIVWEGVQS
jgi:hypothetical protein